MKRRINPIIFIYQWFIFLPVFAVLTIITALSTIILSYLAGDREITYSPARTWARIACYGMFITVQVEGMDRIDKNRSYIFAANHQSMYDIFLVYGWLDSRFKWIMKKELRKIPFVGAACEAAGHIFIDRTSPMAALKSIEVAGKKLSGGSSVVIFPEGTRSQTGQLGKFKRGAFTIASEIKLPIVPLTIKGTFEAMPIWSYNIRPCRLSLIIHNPIEYLPEYDQNQHILMDKVRDVIEKAL
jgi:1-acyl-sn-glycerol-3-phosphate acyltransferase